MDTTVMTKRMDVVARREFRHPAQPVWELLADFGNTEWLAPFFVRREVHGKGLGMTRMLYQSGNGTPAIHRLDGLDNEARVLIYSIHQTVFIPVATIDAVVKVHALDDNRCEVSSTWSYTPPANADLEELYAVTENWMLGALAVMEDYLDRRDG